MDFNKCNDCTNRNCKVNSDIDDANSEISRKIRILDAECPGHIPHKGTFKFWQLALAHPQSMHECLQQFPEILLKNYIR